ncbi:aquaporin-like protein [Pelagophyceae sp. CCMP2097]|nr:aquaporin-like protein [Pelagophyceae sp. CCMP2097]
MSPRPSTSSGTKYSAVDEAPGGYGSGGGDEGVAAPEPAPLAKCVAAETFGTFFLAASIALARGAPLAPVAIGGTLAVMIYALGGVSGGHFNPAVTLGVFLRRGAKRADAGRALSYAAAQLAGAFLAGAYARAVVGDGAAIGFPAVGASSSRGSALLAELGFTAALVLVVLSVATTEAAKGNDFAGLAIGMTVTTAAISVGGISGGAFNPAIGTALPLVAGHAEDMPVYWVGGLGGAALGAAAFRLAQPSHEF